MMSILLFFCSGTFFLLFISFYCLAQGEIYILIEFFKEPAFDFFVSINCVFVYIDIHIHTHNNLSIYRETYFPGDTTGKESTCIAGDLCSIPGLGDLVEKDMATHSSILA